MGSRSDRWMQKYGRSIQDTTGLLIDLIRVVGQYMPLEHLWACISSRTFKSQNYDWSCLCHNCPSMVYPPCHCQKTDLVHNCSIYTMTESGANSFRIHVTLCDWWIGVIFTPSSTLDEALPLVECEDFDTIERLPNKTIAFILERGSGHLLKFDPSNDVHYVRIASGVPQFEGAMYVQVSIVGRSNLNFEVFDNDKTLVWRYPVNFDPNLSNPRPFVQMRQRNNPPSGFATIETLDT
jgi:hypothetical protein